MTLTAEPWIDPRCTCSHPRSFHVQKRGYHTEACFACTCHSYTEDPEAPGVLEPGSGFRPDVGGWPQHFEVSGVGRRWDELVGSVRDGWSWLTEEMKNWRDDVMACLGRVE